MAFAQQYPFLPVEGAPKNVRTLFQDSKGRLWVGGDQLACFDGTRLFFLSDYGFPAAAVAYSITEDSGGAVWIGADTGVYRFAGGRVEEISKGVAVSVTPATPDVIVAATGPPGLGLPASADLVKISRDGKTWKTEKVMSLEASGPLTPDHSGNLLFLCAGGWKEIALDDVVRWRPAAKLAVTFKAVPEFDPKTPPTGPQRVLRDRFGCIWVGSDSEDLYRCDDGKFQDTPFAGLRANLSESADGSMLLVGYNVLAVGRPGHYQAARLTNGLPQLVSALKAQDGTIWLGGAQGLYRFASPFRMEFWTPRDGVDSPWAVQRVGSNVYAGLNRSVAILAKDRQHWQTLSAFDKVGQVVNLLPLPDGNLLVALNPGGAFIIRRDGSLVARNPDAASVYGLRLALVPPREVWLGGIGLGQMVFHGTHLSFATHRLDTQPAGNVLDVQYEEHTRKLWACYNGGLAVRNEAGAWSEISKKDGLLVDACWSLAAMPNGDVWYGYYNMPAFALIRPTDGGRYLVRQFREADGVRDPETLNFDTDRRGWLWRGGSRTLAVADPAQAEAGKWLYLNQSDGVSGEGANTGSFFADADGSVWMGIDLSIFHFSPPADFVEPQFAPQVFVSGYSWDGGTVHLADSVDGAPHGAKLVAHMGSLQFDRRNALQLRYRILPGQGNWRESSSLDLPLGALSTGNHALEVEARLFTGPWSTVIRRTFQVQPPLWLAPRVLLLDALAASILSILIYLWFRRRAAEQAELLPDLADWRARALIPEVDKLSGTVLDARFEVGELIARGGFANVLEGYDRSQKARCAVKVFRSEVGDQAWIRQRFDQEVAALQQMRHQNVVSIYAHGTTPSGTPYLVMEFLEGQNLREALEEGPLSAARTARILRQIGAALDAIHAARIYHRDVKPENIILRRTGSAQEEAVLIDFSIAIVKDANETLYGLSRAAGSFDYMAPEQAIGYAETSTDIYSLAKVAIEMLCGRRLAHLVPATSLDLASRVRDLLAGLKVKLSADSIDMIASALAFDPARRPHVAGSFVSPLVRDLESDVLAAEA